MKKLSSLVATSMLALAFLMPSGLRAADQPNIVLVVMDNLGWGEVGTYGGGILRGAATPNIDSIADQGMKLLNFNVESQCVPSRSALMTGRHPIRSGTTKVVWGVPYGMVGWEKTIPELMSEQGYATGMFGKWHLGDMKGRFPTDQGFDEWYGVPNTTDEAQYSSQSGFDPSVADTPFIVQAKRGETPSKVKPYDLTTRKTIDSELTELTIGFMRKNVQAGKPFFAYIPFTQPHVPPTAHPDFVGKTGEGPWADMLAEMDHRTGQILGAIDDLKIRDNTVVIWMSENGPEQAHSYFGTAGYWRGHYFTTMEGSLRTPFMIRWPGKVEPGTVSNEIVHITDLLPTLAGVAGYQVPTDRMIDGVDQMPFFQGKTEQSARDGFPAYNGNQMQAYKWRDYKVRFIKQDSMFDAPVRLNVPEVYNLKRDPKELFGFSGGMGETGTEHLTWVLPVVIKKVLAFNQTLKQEPPVPFPAPEPYTPPK